MKCPKKRLGRAQIRATDGDPSYLPVLVLTDPHQEIAKNFAITCDNMTGTDYFQDCWKSWVFDPTL